MVPSERLKGIEAFVCAADTGSFTAAGERLGLTNSAVSKGVARRAVIDGRPLDLNNNIAKCTGCVVT